MPIGEEKSVPNVPAVLGARMQNFQGGTIYWLSSAGAHALYGDILAKYNSIGGPAAYGLPTTTQTFAPNIPGRRMVQFGSGNIYWTSTTGAHTVHGAILAEYKATASQVTYDGRNLQAVLGAPTSDEGNVLGVSGARMNSFQGGNIYWSSATGAHAVY